MIWWPFNRNSVAKEDTKPSKPEPAADTPEEGIEPKAECDEVAAEGEGESTEGDMPQQEFFTGDLPKSVTNDQKLMAKVTNQDALAKAFYDEVDKDIATLKDVRLTLKRKRRKAK